MLASEDEQIMIECVPSHEEEIIFADRIYHDTDYWTIANKSKSNKLLLVMGATEEKKKRNKALVTFFICSSPC